jgi:hypothetical protein
VQTNPWTQAACFGAAEQTVRVASSSYKRLVPGLLIAAGRVRYQKRQMKQITAVGGRVANEPQWEI